MNTMPISELIEQVTEICKKNGVKRLDLFGSFATGTSTPTILILRCVLQEKPCSRRLQTGSLRTTGGCRC